MRVFGGLRAFYYLQTLLAGDNETGRNPARFHTRRPLATINSQEKNFRAMIKNLFSKKKNTQNNNNGEKILLDSFIEKYKVANVLDSEMHNQVTNCILQGEKYIYILPDKLNELNSKLKKQKDSENKLSITASLNNEGIALEKAGKIELAIEKYEENIDCGYPAKHSFERLMILYRKRKEYDDEIRVIQSAIKVFSEENIRRFKKALSESKNNKNKEQITKGFENCEQVKGDDGWFIYNPYPVKKFKERLIKAEKLIKNSTL